MTKSEKSKIGIYFLLLIVFIYLVISLFNFEKSIEIFNYFIHLLIKILPIMVIVFVLMFIIDLIINPKSLVKHLGKGTGIKGNFIAIIGGILSTGPIYMWYPLLADLKDKGVSYNNISIFLYNRAVKPALIPLMILYFGWRLVIILTIVMLFASILNGYIVEYILEKKTKKTNE